MAPGEKPSTCHVMQRPSRHLPAQTIMMAAWIKLPMSPWPFRYTGVYLKFATRTKGKQCITTASPTAQYLNACMTAQVKVKLERVGDVCVHCCSCWDVSALPNLQRKERDPSIAEFGYFLLSRALSVTAALHQGHSTGSPSPCLSWKALCRATLLQGNRIRSSYSAPCPDKLASIFCQHQHQA